MAVTDASCSPSLVVTFWKSIISAVCKDPRNITVPDIQGHTQHHVSVTAVLRTFHHPNTFLPSVFLLSDTDLWWHQHPRPSDNRCKALTTGPPAAGSNLANESCLKMCNKLDMFLFVCAGVPSEGDVGDPVCCYLAGRLHCWPGHWLMAH